MNRATLETKLKNLQTQRDQLVANLNATDGAIQVTRQYIEEWEKDEQGPVREGEVAPVCGEHESKEDGKPPANKPG